MKSKRPKKPARQSRTRSERRTSRRNFFRMTLSMLLLLLCWFPMLGGGVRALWTIPAAICISMHEDMYFCMAAGVVGGFGIDIACGNPLGVNAIYLVICCTFVCLLFEQILRRSFFHYFVLTALCTFLRSGFVYLFSGVLFRVSGRELLWERVLLPSSLRTAAAAIPVFLCFLPLSRLLTKRVRSMDAAAISRELS
ncbi:MAG: rod shape-determining protein MreD [Oscillospiraceae bacterium]|nr:rod shape-determining protein MreD [Oscillospiraceae bacterium]